MVQQTSKFVTYQLTISISKPVIISVGKFGLCNFPAGEYIYTGSARQHIDARIARHLRTEKALRWHIDYLLNAAEASVIKVEQYLEYLPVSAIFLLHHHTRNNSSNTHR